MKKETILVIGSKPDAILPDVVVKKIYVANGAAERAIIYKIKNPLTHIISITGKTALKVKEVRSRIEKLKPNEIVSHNGKINLREFFNNDWVNDVSHRFLNKKGIDLQKKYYSYLTLRVADFGLIFGSGNILFGILRFIYALFIKRKPPMGLTTGCLSILMALSENEKSEVLVAGIGLKGGKHYYKYKGKFPDYRGWADAYLIKRLPKNLKSRLLTTDIDFSKIANIKLLKNKII